MGTRRVIGLAMALVAAAAVVTCSDPQVPSAAETENDAPTAVEAQDVDETSPDAEAPIVRLDTTPLPDGAVAWFESHTGSRHVWSWIDPNGSRMPTPWLAVPAHASEPERTPAGDLLLGIPATEPAESMDWWLVPNAAGAPRRIARSVRAHQAWPTDLGLLARGPEGSPWLFPYEAGAEASRLTSGLLVPAVQRGPGCALYVVRTAEGDTLMRMDRTRLSHRVLGPSEFGDACADLLPGVQPTRNGDHLAPAGFRLSPDGTRLLIAEASEHRDVALIVRDAVSGGRLGRGHPVRQSSWSDYTVWLDDQTVRVCTETRPHRWRGSLHHACWHIDLESGEWHRARDTDTTTHLVQGKSPHAAGGLLGSHGTFHVSGRELFIATGEEPLLTVGLLAESGRPAVWFSPDDEHALAALGEYAPHVRYGLVTAATGTVTRLVLDDVTRVWWTRGR